MDFPRHAVFFISFLLLIVVSPTHATDTLRFANFELVSGLENYIITESALWIKNDVRSPGLCAVVCLEDIPCRSIFYNKLTMDCTGHSSVLTSRAMATDDPGSCYYVNLQPRELTSIGDGCSNDKECYRTEFAVCYMGSCLCTPGYSYSLTRKTCNRNCSSYSSSMTSYPGLAIAGHNTETNWDMTAEECINRCATAVTTCRTVDTHIDGQCFLQEPGYLDVQPEDQESGQDGWVLYQRDCSD